MKCKHNVACHNVATPKRSCGARMWLDKGMVRGSVNKAAARGTITFFIWNICIKRCSFSFIQWTDKTIIQGNRRKSRRISCMTAHKEVVQRTKKNVSGKVFLRTPSSLCRWSWVVVGDLLSAKAVVIQRKPNAIKRKKSDSYGFSKFDLPPQKIS